MNDKRLNWEYDGCEIVPINCFHPTRGKVAEPIFFGKIVRSQYWRIDFPDESWIHVDTKAECRKYIDTCRIHRPDRWKKPAKKGVYDEADAISTD